VKKRTSPKEIANCDPLQRLKRFCGPLTEEKNVMKKIARVFPFVLCIFALSCGQQSNEEKILGTWNISAQISSSEFRENPEEPIPEDVDLSLKASGTQTFQKNGTSSDESEITLTIKGPNGVMPLVFHCKGTGSWSVDGDKLSETIEESIAVPANEMTKMVVKESPDILEVFQPKKGELVISTILSISDTAMETQSDETKIKVTYKRKR
jgi:hypothetical protein